MLQNVRSSIKTWSQLIYEAFFHFSINILKHLFQMIWLKFYCFKLDSLCSFIEIKTKYSQGNFLCRKMMFLYACLVFGSASIALGQTSCMSAQVIGSYHCLSLIWYLYTGDLFVSTTYNWVCFCYYYNCVICITIHRKCHMGERGFN